MGIINFTMPEVGSFLVDIIIWLVKISSSIAVGIILFTVLLKLITLPFDYASRASMRKNSLKMEEMRPELEKLQRQYADNKELYNQKMMALYKKNGYSMFGSCLPTILTLVIFIVAINAFTDYSQYQNKMDFYQMSQSYNNIVYAGFDIDDQNSEYIYRNENGEIEVNGNKVLALFEGETEDVSTRTFGKNMVAVLTKSYKVEGQTKTLEYYKLQVNSSNGYAKVTAQYSPDFNQVGIKEFSLADNALENVKLGNLKSAENNEFLNAENLTFTQAYEKEVDRINQLNADKAENEKQKIPTETEYLSEFLNDIQSYLSAVKFREVQAKFLWIKNIWITDSAMKHPVMSDWEEFRVTHEYEGNNIGVAGYEKLIKHLDKEVNEPNGYFILVALTALTSLALQLISGKSQKAQMELQTVDGQGAQTQKVMQWMMPIMMGFFAFMYTSAFSIYIIVSSIISIITTFGINWIVDIQIKKERAKKGIDEIRGRVYVPKEEKPEPKKEKKKKENTPENDFLSGKADNKQGRIRGRIK